MLAHAFRPQLVGLTTRTFTGWLTVETDGTARYAPHTARGLAVPPQKTLLLVTNGLVAKYGLWQAERRGTRSMLVALAATQSRS